jgi:uncharacterized protein YjbJ (UPF0337 family)
MTHTRMIILALFAALSLAVFSGCSAEDIESKTNNALGDVKEKMGDVSLDGFKGKFDELGFDAIEKKAEELKKLDLPAVKKALAEKEVVKNFMDTINAENMGAKLKELGPMFEKLGQLAKEAKAALGM